MARTRTSYWSVPALNVETFCPATSVLIACAMSPTLHAEISRTRAIDDDLYFRLAADQCRVGVDHVGNRLHLLEQRVGVLRQLLKSGPPMTY